MNGGICHVRYAILLCCTRAVNNCNGRGDCTDDGLCNCWPGFRNGDCSERKYHRIEMLPLSFSHSLSDPVIR